MPPDTWFLRIAEPIDPWDPVLAMSEDDAVEQLTGEDSWSMFACADEAFARVILAAFYGARRGRGPMASVGYVVLGRELVEALGCRLEHTPQHFAAGPQGERWPPEVAEAHYDLLPIREEFVRSIRRQAIASSGALTRLSRAELLVEQVTLMRRADCVESFRKTVGERLRKLAKNERPIYDSLVTACQGSKTAPPTETDWK